MICVKLAKNLKLEALNLDFCEALRFFQKPLKYLGLSKQFSSPVV